MNYIKDIELYNKDELDTINVIVEIPKGTRKKYELVEPNFDRVEYKRKVKGRYPYYYGCMPQTYAGDKDPADVILLTSKKHKILDIVKAQPIATIKTLDNGEEDNKIICIEGIVKNIAKLEYKVMKYLHTYKGKKANMIIDENVYGVEEAIKNIDKAHKDFIELQKGKTTEKLTNFINIK